MLWWAITPNTKVRCFLFCWKAKTLLLFVWTAFKEGKIQHQLGPGLTDDSGHHSAALDPSLHFWSLATDAGHSLGESVADSSGHEKMGVGKFGFTYTPRNLAASFYPWKSDGWKTILSLWDGIFSRASCSTSGGVSRMSNEKGFHFLRKCFNQIHNEKALNSHSFATSLGDSWCNPHNTEDMHLWEIIGNPRNFVWMSILIFRFQLLDFLRKKHMLDPFPNSPPLEESIGAVGKKNSLQVGRWNEKKNISS